MTFHSGTPFSSIFSKAILDGQQRFTALYIGLKGTYAYKMPRKRWNSDSAFPERSLYLNLLSESKELGMKYIFRFLTKSEAAHSSENHYWFRIGKILDLVDEFEVNDYLIKNQLLNREENKSRFANATLFKLHSIIHKDRPINYYLEKDQKLDKVLNIFIRVNSGGTELSYSDLLLSIATAQWKNRDAREEISKLVDEINKLGDGFNFNKDFVLKSCLVLSDFSAIGFKVDNFNKENMLTIETNWPEISSALKQATNLISSFGYGRDTLPTNYALIPIAYYLLKLGCPRNFVDSFKYIDDRISIARWIKLSILKRTFGGQPDNVLRPIRQVISANNSEFPFKAIVNKLKGKTKSLTFTDEDIENLLFYKYGQNYTFSVLALLYPTLDFKNRFHIDHIHPSSFFQRKKLTKKGIDESQIDYYLENFNHLANLQLLEGIPNQEKSDTDFSDWMNKTYPKGKRDQERQDFMKRNCIPDVDLSFDNFQEFIKGREQLLTNRLKEILRT